MLGAVEVQRPPAEEEEQEPHGGREPDRHLRRLGAQVGEEGRRERDEQHEPLATAGHAATAHERRQRRGQPRETAHERQPSRARCRVAPGIVPSWTVPSTRANAQ